VTLTENNVVSKLAGATAVGAFSFVDSTNLTVDSVDSGIGIIAQPHPVNLTVGVTNGSLTVNEQVRGANINLIADNMALNNHSPISIIDAGTGGILTLTPLTPANTISVGGTDAAGTLGIDDNDLANVTAKAVR